MYLQVESLLLMNLILSPNEKNVYSPLCFKLKKLGLDHECNITNTKKLTNLYNHNEEGFKKAEV